MTNSDRWEAGERIIFGKEIFLTCVISGEIILIRYFSMPETN
jgi:hypothetical protein